MAEHGKSGKEFSGSKHRDMFMNSYLCSSYCCALLFIYLGFFYYYLTEDIYLAQLSKSKQRQFYLKIYGAPS